MEFYWWKRQFLCNFLVLYFVSILDLYHKHKLFKQDISPVTVLSLGLKVCKRGFGLNIWSREADHVLMSCFILKAP